MRVTLDEIARRAHVSKATVSRVLNNSPVGVGAETRARVAAIIESSGYSAAGSGERSVRTQTIGLILPDITNPFFADLAKSVEKCAYENGYIVILGNTDDSREKEKEYVSTFVSKKVDGVILVSADSIYRKDHDFFAKYHIPVVLLDRMVPMSFTAGVFTDNEYAIFSACDFLIRHGTDKIAFIAGPDTSTSQERLEGYKVALKQHGIPFSEALVKKGNYSMESGYGAVMELEKEGTRFNGIVASNDTMALGAMRALKELAYSIPGEVEVFGFDNIAYTLMCDPQLTTIQQPTTEMGRLGVQLLLEAIQGKDLQKKTVRLQPRLVFRQTTRP